MNPILKNVLAVLIGLFIGGQVNGLIISQGSNLFPLPEGVNPNDIESIKSHIHLYEPKHFLAPFLAHAIGTFVAAFICALIAAKSHMRLMLIVGGVFTLGGIAAIAMIGGPVWFMIVDLLFAYFPMAFLGFWIAKKIKPSIAHS
jgi:hypothetical protein